MSGQPIIFDFTVSIGGMTAPIARATLDSAGEQGSSLLGLQLAEDIPDFVRSMSSAVADQISKVLLMDAKTDAGFLPSIELADYLPEGVTIDANPEAKKHNGETIALAIIMLLALAWLLTHDGCAHPIGNTIALAVYVASGVLLTLPWAIEKLEPYLTESEDQQ